ncbi:Hypothetical_protein [Hexamita inflata]|uniref:Hypothetical_protein n=1 Tax=Hexamita inflata TaxID=28002 RepID=A0AA86N633_9EUKA|nr:Hypothetical protein HINF_LOCUS1091 [Hexamita inflata]
MMFSKTKKRILADLQLSLKYQSDKSGYLYKIERFLLKRTIALFFNVKYRFKPGKWNVSDISFTSSETLIWSGRNYIQYMNQIQRRIEIHQNILYYLTQKGVAFSLTRGLSWIHFTYYSTLFVESITFSVIETVTVYLQSPRKKAFPENKSSFLKFFQYGQVRPQFGFYNQDSPPLNLIHIF